ncbi:ABC transporter permease [Nonomuraea jabiensis]|uniref:Putative ABC transport system permease protein n=1 Tax=Nonomuraea jabiensis TaxID=882448 RepID=A0A7W9G7E2_9ACTN|nr:ABC transporter permease [Nonomuraea jabiensis]MBB5778620.1 putative ABC transport system permease protein [Nonomuraea jabiensis]
MLRIAWSTLRVRWSSFAGTFVALAFGAALMAALGQVLASSITSPDRGPQRYAAAPVVVAPDERLTLRTPFGERGAPLAEPRGLDPELARRIPGAVVDRIFAAQLAGGPPAVGRPWSAARTAPQRLTSGRAPAADDEIVVTAGARVGRRVQVVTAAGSRSYRVVGIATAGPQPTVFFTDGRAARLSPRIDALAVWRPATEVRTALAQASATHASADHASTDHASTDHASTDQASADQPTSDQAAPGQVIASGAAPRQGGTPVVSTEVKVLTGQERALLDPSRESDEQARNNANTIAGIAAGFAGFIAVFVVSSTFAFAVGQRQREFALLRTVGATTGQVRRMVYGEALLVAIAASALGALTGPLATRPILDLLSSLGMAPAWLLPSTSSVPSYVAFGTGVLVAVLGVVVAAWRAGRVRPAEALRQAAVEPRAMTPGRWIAGGGLLATAVISMAVNAVSDPSGATNNKTFMPIVMLLIAAAGLLAPVVVRPVANLLAAPLGRLRGAGALVVPAGAVASTRRTAATAAPVLMTVALAATLLGGAAMTDATKAAMRIDPVRADYVVLPSGPAGLDRQLSERLRAIPGADVTTVTPTSLYTLEGAGTQLIQRPAEAVNPATLTTALSVPVTAGSLKELRDDTIAVSPTWEVSLGQRVRLWRADGSQVSLTVVALLGADSTADAYVTPTHALSARPSLAYVKLRPGASASASKALEQAVTGHNARSMTKSAWAGTVTDRAASASRLGLLAVLGIMLSYTVIAQVNTLLMAAPDRAGEHGALRLLGATKGQVLRYVVAEALLVVAVGVLLAALATALGLLGLYAALLQLAGPVAIEVPWQPVIGVIALCSVLAVLATVLPASRVRAVAIPT